MANLIDVVIPDIGGAEDVDVIEVLVAVGDEVNAEDSLITLESEKATMDIPAPAAGKVAALKIKIGDKVSEGDVILQLEAAGDAAEEPKAEAPAESKAEPQAVETAAEKPAAQAAVIEVHLPDIGTDDAVDVIEVHVAAGDDVAEETPLLTLESEKATMDVPAPEAGKITELKVKVGDKVKTNDVIAMLETSAAAPAAKEEVSAAPAAETKTEASPQPKVESKAEVVEVNQGDVHAGPGVRRLANELGINLSQVSGSGPKNRITRDDLTQFAKSGLQGGGTGSGLNIATAPKVDFAKFGEVDVQPLSRIKKLSGSYLHRNWVTIPHITQFDEADITDLEAFRQANKAEAEKQGAKLTPLVFIMKAVVSALKAYPQFNASLDESGSNLVLKKYFHIGVAVDTPNGLVVPVIRDVDQKGFVELAKELAEFSKKARAGKLLPTDMQGGCFSISSLGGIGGTAFTPIVNAPEVSILGVSKSEIKPKFIDNEFQPRLMLPLSLSYDHRVIDGAEAARFIVHLSQALTDLRRLLL